MSVTEKRNSMVVMDQWNYFLRYDVAILTKLK